MADMSWKVSTPPMILSCLILQQGGADADGDAFLVGPVDIHRHVETGTRVSMVRRSMQPVSHTSARNTSKHGLPRACARGIPVIFSAARLKEVMRQSISTVNTPS